MTLKNGLTYANAGVDIDAGNEMVDKIKPLVRATRRPGADAEIGGFGGLFDLKAAGFTDPILVGANDGGSSTAAVLETARVMAKTKPEYTVWFVLFDGEEAVVDWNEMNGMDNTYGSRHYVTTLKTNNELSNTGAMILLDMMGYKNLELGRDTMSTKWLLDVIWETGYDLDHGDIFVERDEGVGGDDHEAFIKAGIPAVDLIQLTSYPYWHKADDTIDKISAQSMKTVGDTVLASLPKIAARIASQKTRG